MGALEFLISHGRELVDSLLPSMVWALVMSLDFLEFFGEDECTVLVFSIVEGDSVFCLPGGIFGTFSSYFVSKDNCCQEDYQQSLEHY